MFDPQSAPRVFALPPGANFAKALARGLVERTKHLAPHSLAQARVVVNSSRMARALRSELVDQGASLLPQILLVTDLPSAFPALDPGAPVPTLDRKLELAQLVQGLFETGALRAPRSTLFDLTDALYALFAEMQAEGVPFSALKDLDVAGSADHWQQALAFLSIATTFHEARPARDVDGRLRGFAEAADEAWADTPPRGPLIIAGSTGSRGATRILMKRVAQLDQGALVLPGFDETTPPAVWATLQGEDGTDDHPQYRYATLLRELDLSAAGVLPWNEDEPPASEARKIVSLALRPAPVTDQWIVEGRAFEVLDQSLSHLDLIEAPTPRAEALAIACRIRAALRDGQSVAVVTPDRMLTRQISAALARWNIVPDDSAGRPLHLTASGQFLRLTLRRGQLTSSDLITLLKSPICNSAAEWRGPHLLNTRELELWLRRNRVAFPLAADLAAWAEDRPERAAWALWVQGMLNLMAEGAEDDLNDQLAHHRSLAEALSDGQGASGTGALWQEDAGAACFEIIEQLGAAAAHGGTLAARDYAGLIENLLQAGSIRQSEHSHPDVQFLGTLEVRTSLADVVILGGLNEGSWPAPAAPDPWLNRKMRADVGLTLPERQIGLAAHDFQQAIGAGQVVLTRALRTDDAPSVASRWLSRLTNLLGGLPEAGGPKAVEDMKSRGAHWVALAKSLEATPPTPPARRPAPVIPVDHRPKRFSVTAIERLIRDPYTIYAQSVLGLRALDPMVMTPNAALRGTALHRIYETFVRDVPMGPLDEMTSALVEIAKDVLTEETPWPAIRQMWLSKAQSTAEWFAVTERERQLFAAPTALEQKGSVLIPGTPIELVAKADRIDTGPERVRVYDYKSGSAPDSKSQRHFNKQLILEMLMLRLGGFETIAAEGSDISAVYIGLGGTPAETAAALKDQSLDDILSELQELLLAWQDQNRGYLARRFPQKKDWNADYDHLARYGEWDDGDDPAPEVLQ